MVGEYHFEYGGPTQMGGMFVQNALVTQETAGLNGLLKQSHVSIFHLNPELLTLHMWILSTQHCDRSSSAMWQLIRSNEKCFATGILDSLIPLWSL